MELSFQWLKQTANNMYSLVMVDRKEMKAGQFPSMFPLWWLFFSFQANLCSVSGFSVVVMPLLTENLLLHVVTYIFFLQGVSILVFYWCVTFYHNLTGLKEHAFIISHICMLEVWTLAGFFAQGIMSENQLSWVFGGPSKAHFQSSFALLAELCSLQL